MNFTHPLTVTNIADPNVLAIGQRAFAAQQKGVATGDWTDFLVLISDDIEFHAPSPHIPKEGIYGKPAVAATLQKFTAELSLNGKLTQLKPMTCNETTVAIEFFAEGQFGGEFLTHNLVVFYEIKDGQIKRFQEYIGRI